MGSTVSLRHGTTVELPVNWFRNRVEIIRDVPVKLLFVGIDEAGTDYSHLSITGFRFGIRGRAPKK